MKPIQRILVATDFSECAATAAVGAAQLAGQLHAAVEVLTVVDTSPLADAYGDAAFRGQRIAEIHKGAHGAAEEFARRHLAGCKPVAVHVRDGNTALEIVGAAQDLRSDMIVMGTHGRTGIAHLVLGSVAEKVVRQSSVPVLTVRGGASEG